MTHYSLLSTALCAVLMSFIHSGLTQDFPRSTLTVTPDNTVFTGERVRLTCVIESDHSDWRYEWRKGNSYYTSDSQLPERLTVDRNTLTIKRSDLSDEGQYTCRGWIDGYVSSQSSSAVYLSVKDLPKPKLTVTPDRSVFTGETVNLKCVIESYSVWRQRNDLTYDQRYDWKTDWRYEWYKGSVKLQSSDRYTVNTDTLTIRGATESDRGHFWCRGRRDGRPNSSQESERIDLAVNDLPKTELSVDPESPVFTGETVNLTCVIESNSVWRQRNGLTHDQRYYWTPVWRYEWYKDTDSVKLQSSDRYTVNTDTLTIRAVTTSDEGQYTCRGQRDKRPNSSQESERIDLAVNDLPIPQLTVDPKSPVFTGETVNLKCVIESYSYWTYEWYKGTDRVKSSWRYTVNTHTLTIRGATKSDAGQYTCKGQRHGSPSSSQESEPIDLAVNDSPRSTLTVTPDKTVFTGERVILTCVIESDHRDWRYEWWRGNSNIQVSQRLTVDRNTLTIEGSESSDEGQYTCRGHIEGRSVSSQSSSVSLSVTERPEAVVKVSPDQRVFRGETVTLTCDIQRRGHIQWTYSWFKDGNTRHIYRATTAELSFRASVSSSGEYSCRGERSDSQRSHTSAALTLTVSDLPKTELTVTPDRSVFTGERVILKCVIESDHRDWRYEWRRGNTYYTSISQSSQRHTVDRNTLTIEGSESSDEGQYTCRGHIEGRSVSTQSSSVSLSVKAFPRSTLTVTPDNTVFTGERVRLTCVINPDHRDWRYEWYKDRNKVSQRHTVVRNTLTIEGSESSDEGQYTCRGLIEGRSVSSQSSSAVFLSVKDLPKTKLTVDPKSPVFTGETVNLTCVIESNHTEWRYEWYKIGNNSVKLQSSDRYTVNTDTLTIRGATESDRGQFWCRGHIDERSVSSKESERINLSVNVSAASSSLLVTGVVVGSSVCLLFFLSLLLMWRYKKNKDQQRNINQTSVPNQSAQSQLENFPLESDSDHIYDDVTEVNKRNKDDSEPLTDVTYSEVTVTKKMDKAKAESNNVTYSEVGKRGKKCKSKDINPAGPSDLTYAEINIQDKKKTKGKGKSSESGDTLYSELKQNTDRDADAGVGDTTSALAFWKKGQKKINKTCP